MTLGSSKQGFSLWVLVCLLVCCTIVLVIEAKRSQYHSGTTATYLSKATKMRESQPAAWAVLLPRPGRFAPDRALLVTRLPLPGEPSRPKLFPFLDSFRFRPPPA